MDAQDHLEPGCFAETFERKYYHTNGCFIKRSLRPKEFKKGYKGLYIPRLNNERLMNEAASLRYIGSNTDIPVPKVYCDFEDDHAYYLITEYVEGVNMADLKDDQKKTVHDELRRHLDTLQALRSNRLGGPSGIVIPPFRVMELTDRNNWPLKESETAGYIFCHNDLSQHNIIVNPDTLRITGIVDWEYAGHYPPNFESPFYKRIGPSSAIKDEKDDSRDLLEFLTSQL